MTYRVGISGLGRGVGPARIFALMPDCKVVAGCDPDAAARQRFEAQFPGAKGFADYNAMLRAGLDIVFVGTPMPLHREQTVAALEAGGHVLQEVTLANTIEECREILEAVKAHPRQKFMLAENNCYRAPSGCAALLSWQKMWAKGWLGQFMSAEAEYIHDIRPLLRRPDGSPTWRAKRPPIVYCTHSLGPLLKVTGERCVTACGMHCGNKLEPELGHLDFEVAIFQTSSGGVIKVLRAQAVAREPAMHYYSLYGTKGCLETTRPPASPLQTNAYFEDIPHVRTMIPLPLGENVPGAPSAATQGGHGTLEYYMVQDFMESVRNDTPPPLDIYAALEMTLPGLCAHESAMRGGEPVAIPDWRG
jgi:predicted dehydrogenase